MDPPPEMEVRLSGKGRVNHVGNSHAERVRGRHIAFSFGRISSLFPIRTHEAGRTRRNLLK